MNELAAQRTVAKINLAALARNISRLDARIPSPDALCCVVKADAYGHGAAQVARRAQQSGVSHYAVASVAEAVALRGAKITGDIYIMSPFVPREAESIVRYDLIPFLSNFDQWKSLQNAAENAPIAARAFLIVDTGMGREGMEPDSARYLWQTARTFGRNVRVSGIGTHYATASESDSAFTHEQNKIFADFLRRIALELSANDDGRGNKGIWITCNNSPALLKGIESPHLNGVRGQITRVGIALYGIAPYENALSDTKLERVMDWTTHISLIRTMPSGKTIGYGRTHTFSGETTVATISIGYADGFPRRLSNLGHVIIRGKTCAVVGRVNMDQAAIDISAVPDARIGDIVTILGDDGGVSQSADAIARLLDTTPHEITCGITQRVPRRYVADGTPTPESL